MKIVNRAELNELVKKEGYLLVDFFADWCNPCRMLGPVLEAVDSNFPNVEIVKVNVEEEGELAAEYGVSSIPSVFLLKDGKQVAHFSGFMNAERLTDFLVENTK